MELLNYCSPYTTIYHHIPPFPSPCTTVYYYVPLCSTIVPRDYTFNWQFYKICPGKLGGQDSDMTLKEFSSINNDQKNSTIAWPLRIRDFTYMGMVKMNILSIGSSKIWVNHFEHGNYKVLVMVKFSNDDTGSRVLLLHSKGVIMTGL